MNAEDQKDPTQAALEWIARALTDAKNGLVQRGEVAAAEAYHHRANAAIQQIQIALLPKPPASPTEVVTDAAPIKPNGRGRPRIVNPEPAAPQA